MVDKDIANDKRNGLYAEASRMRHALETLAPALATEHLGSDFGDFPVGSCGASCEFLAKWLDRKGINDISRVCGWRDGKSHAWLEIAGTIVDITSDQFDDGFDSVYVGTDRSFHQSFGKQERCAPNLDIGKRHLYKKIMDHLMACA